MKSHRRSLLLLTLVLALCVITLGAYVRLSDAGLGCPDWPGCYGKLIGVPQHAIEVASAQQAFPSAPVEAHKAWKEMIHRYAAGTLGLLIAVLAYLAWRGARQANVWVASFLVALVGLQAALGMWTVTQLLKPVIVTLHLLGGMAIWATLLGWWFGQRASVRTWGRLPAGVGVHAWGFVVVVVVQIALGGWTSSNYAAMACTDYPTCQGAWWPAMDWGHAFTFNRELGLTADGAGLPLPALTAIHWVHRWFAVVVLGTAVLLAKRLLQTPHFKMSAVWVLVTVLLQWALGLSNVWLQWPLSLAVLHNTGAALVLAVAVSTAVRLTREPA